MIFDGKKFAFEKEAGIRIKVSSLLEKGITPKLVTILVGENQESELYLKLKANFAKRCGIGFELQQFSENSSVEEIVSFINSMNIDSSVHGIMVQLPLPPKFDHNSLFIILNSISIKKDVDCLNALNLGLVMMGNQKFLPATVSAVVNILQNEIRNTQNEEKWLTGENVVIIGASEIVGKPLSMVLSDAGATVTICRSTTKNLSDYTQKADVIISAVGKPGLITKEMIKEGSVLIDVGITSEEGEDGKRRTRGDIEQDCAEKALFITPVPGGVGPVTVACLFENLLASF